MLFCVQKSQHTIQISYNNGLISLIIQQNILIQASGFPGNINVYHYTDNTFINCSKLCQYSITCISIIQLLLLALCFSQNEIHLKEDVGLDTYQPNKGDRKKVNIQVSNLKSVAVEYTSCTSITSLFNC